MQVESHPTANRGACGDATEMVQFTRLLERARIVRDVPETHGPRIYERATLGDAPLVLLTTGMGMVAAAAATEAVIERYGPRVVLNFGCAGAHREDILPGDVIVGTGCIAFDHGFLQPDGVFDARTCPICSWMARMCGWISCR